MQPDWISRKMWQFTGQQRPSFALEPDEGQESVWDYPRPPLCVPDHRKVTVGFQEELIARSTRCIRVLETASPPTIYIPADDVFLELLIKDSGSSFCEWKGVATYWSLNVEGKIVKNVGWSYEIPSASFTDIKGYFSFYPAKVECRVDQELVRPQPGGFYGGWVTDEIIGPYKGQPGTGGW